jgi:hypothetical protein
MGEIKTPGRCSRERGSLWGSKHTINQRASHTRTRTSPLTLLSDATLVLDIRKVSFLEATANFMTNRSYWERILLAVWHDE